MPDFNFFNNVLEQHHQHQQQQSLPTFSVASLPSDLAVTALSPAQERRQQQCQKWATRFNVVTGLPQSFSYVCGLFRHCQHCAETRAHKYESQIMDVVVEGTQVYFDVFQTREEAYAQLQGLTKPYYLILPMTDGTTAVFWKCWGAAGLTRRSSAIAVTPISGHALNWVDLTTTPEGMKLVGSLGSTKKVADADAVPAAATAPDYATVFEKLVFTNAPAEVEHTAATVAVTATAALDPHGLGELTAAILQRTSVYKAQIVYRGFVVTAEISRAIKVDLNKLCWRYSVINNQLAP